MAPQRHRESTPDNPGEEVRTRYLTVTKDANIDQKTSHHVWSTFDSMRVKCSMDGDMMEWLLPGAYAYAISQKPVNVESKVVLIKLLKATGLSVFSFYSRVKKWVEVAPLSSIARDIFQQSERYFQISHSVFERFEQMFTCIFCDPLDKFMLDNVFHRNMSLRKKHKLTFPKIVQAIDVYVFAWDLFVRLRRAAPVIRDDPLSCYNLLICVMDLICHNVLAMKRPELLNSGCQILPDPKLPPENGGVDKNFTLRPYLCAKFEAIHQDCHSLYVNGFLPLMRGLVDDHEITANGPGFLELMTPDNYEKNIKSLNSTYETFIRIGCAADERIFLVSQDTDAPGVGGDPMNVMDVIDTMKERRKFFPASNRKLELNDFKTPTPVIQSPVALPTPLTPSSSCSALERRAAQDSVKSPPLQTAVDLVTQLTNLTAGRSYLPSENLKEIWLVINGTDISEEYVARAADYREKFVTAYVRACDPTRLVEPYTRQRFMFAQMWYFKLVEDMLVSELKRGSLANPRIKKLANSDKFQTSLFALSVEMVLFSYNCDKMFPWPIEVLDLASYYFVKVIEPVVLLEPLPKTIIKHLGRVEETIYEQLVWKSDSPVWAEITADGDLLARNVCWGHQVEDSPVLPAGQEQSHTRRSVPTPVVNTAQNRVADGELSLAVTKPVRNSAVSLFFRKVYVLAGLRLRELCNQLKFDADVEKKYHVFQRMFTLFENTLTQHTDILKDRHLDQILLSCVYVVAKLEAANGLDRTFHMIMNAYRMQPQSESRVYRMVLITPGQAETGRRSHAGGEAFDSPNTREVRADIITFYNTVFVRVMQDFIAKFSPKKKGQATPGVMLSPVPRVPSRDTRRQIHPSARIWVSPRKIEPEPTPQPANGRVLTFTFGVTGQIDAVVNANSAAALARKVIMPPTKRIITPAIITGPCPKRQKFRKNTPAVSASPGRAVAGARGTTTTAVSFSPVLSFANSLPPPLAEPPNFPPLAGVSSAAASYQDPAMPDSL